MADWWEKYKKDRNLGGNKKSSSKRTWLKKEVSVTDENRQTAKSSTWWEDYKKTRDLDSKVAANRQRAERSQRFGSANRQLEQNRSRDAAEDEIRELFRNPFSSDAEWQAGVLQRNAERYKRDLPLYQQALQNASTWGEYFSTHRQAGESQSAVKHQFERYQQATQKAEQDRNENNLVNRPALYASEHMTPEQISAELDRLRSGAATPTVTDKDRNDPSYAYMYPDAVLRKDPHGARFDERLVEDAGQDAIDALYRPILTEQEKAAVEEADRQIIEDKANRNYERVQILKAAQSMQTERTSRETGNQLMEEIANGGAAAKQVEAGRDAFEAKQHQIASETSFEIGDDLDSNRGAYNKMQKERRERGYILGYDWDNVPEARKQAVYALYAQDPEKAMELAKYYIADARQAEDEERQAWYAQSGWTAALGLVSSAAAHLGAAVDPFGDVGQELTRRGDNALAGGSQWADAATDYKKIPEWVPIVGGKGAGDFYQTVGSVVQSAAVAAPAILAGRYDTAAAETIGKLGLALMGSSAAASDYRESVAAGMDEDRAKLHALAAGVEEALFEEVSLDKLIKMDTSGGLKSALKNWLVQSGIEGSEELATSIANRITDEMISGAGQSKVERRASELIANGMNSTEAHTQAESEWMTDTLYEGFSGFLSGGMMTGGNYALQGAANLTERAVNAVETRKAQRQAGAAVSRSEGSVEALQAYAKDKGIEIKGVETAEQSAEQGGQKADQNSYSARDYRSISNTNSKVVQSIRNDLRGKTVQEQQAVRDSLVEKYGEGIAPVVNNAISVETASRVRQEYGNVDSIQAARNRAVGEIKDESLRRAVSDGYDSAAYSLAASQGGEGGMNAMSRYIQQRRNTGSGSEMSMNATVTAQDGSTKTIAITGMSEDGKRVSLADGSEVAVKDLQADADTTSAIQQLADLDLGDDATKVLQAYQQSGVAGTEGYRWLMDYATAYNQGRTRQISLEQAAQRSSLDERTVMDAYTLGQQAANRETQAGLEKLKNLPKRKGANGRTANIDTTEIKGKTMSKSELEQFELANQYAQALGVDMKWFSSKEKDGKFVGKNGAYENGKVYMDIHAGRNFAADLTSGILATMGHELTHFQQQYAPEEYQAIKEFLFEQIVKSSPNGEARLERLIWEKQKRSGNTLSRKAAEDEVVADACQKMLRDSKAVHDFASQQPEAANGVVRWLDKWFKRVRSIFGRGGNYSEEAQLMDSLEQDVKAAFGELWDKALKQAAKVHDEVGNIENAAIQEQNSDREDYEDTHRGQGYDGYSMSVNAREAYDRGEMPMSKWSKSAILDAAGQINKEKADLLRGINADTLREHLLEHVGWHHTSSMYNRTDFYAINENAIENLTADTVQAWDRVSKKPTTKNAFRGDFYYTEWSGTRNHPKAYNKVLHDVNIQEKGSFYIVTDDEGNVLVRKKIGSNGTRAVDYAEEARRQEAKKAIEQRRIDNSTEAANALYAKMKKEGMEYSSSGNIYQSGRKPSRYDYAIGIDKFFKEGEQRLSPNDSGGYVVETFQKGEWVREGGDKAQNSDRDTEYLELSKDPEKNAARLQEMVDEAAKRAGYTIKAYHGTETENRFTVFDEKLRGKNHGQKIYDESEEEQRFKALSEKAFYFATDKEYAEQYGDNVMSVFLREGEQSDISYREISEMNPEEIKQLLDEWKSDGIDSFYIHDYDYGNDEIGVFYSNQIKSADPVTYDDSGNVIPLSERFNEANEDIRYSSRPTTDSTGRELSEGQQEYFKDSKILDKYGNLLVLYHGGPGMTVFRGRESSTFSKNAIYMTDEKEIARAYAGTRGKTQKLYANITNPLVLDAQGRNYTDIPIPTDAPQSLLDYFWYDNTADLDNLPVYAEENGYDGVIVYNVREGVGGGPMTEVIAFQSNQVKNVDNHNPTNNPDIRYSERDAEYLEAVESNEDWKAEKMVRDAAVQWGAATDERGKPIPLYHGTPRFGFTVFKDPAHEVPFIYTSTNPTVSAHYAGDKNYAGRRPIGRKYRTGTKTEDIIENAKWVYESNFHVMSTEEKLKVYKEIEKQAIEIADKLDEVHIGAWNAESEAFKNMPDEVANAISWVEDMFWTIRDSDYKFNFDGKEDYPGERAEFFKVLDSDIENAKTQRAIVQEFYDENRKNLSKLEKAFLSYLLSYEVGDAAIDIEYKLRRVATENDVIMNEAGNIDNPLDLKESMDMYHEIGAYTLYGNLGDNPFIFDANGAQFWGVKVPEMGDGYYSTDSISKWAYENGYTGVVMKNIYDYGDKADNYVFFNSSQLKSADPVTYDDSGSVIPLSERFNESNEDIRYSERDNAYRSAVDSEDLETARKMVEDAANEAGYTIRAYHGTGGEFNSFDLQRSGSNSRELVGDSAEGMFFFSSIREAYPGSAQDYARIAGKRTGQEVIRDVYLKMENPLELDSKGWYATADYYDNNRDSIYDQYLSGDYDGIIIRDSSGGDDNTIYLLDDANRIKSAETVVYDDQGNLIPLSERFNPDNPDIRYSERDYSAPSDEELLMNAKVEDAENQETRAALQNSQKQARQIRGLTRRLERLQTEIRGYEGDNPNRISVQRFTRQALDLFGIPAGVRTDMGELLQSVAEGVLAGHNLSQNDIMYFFETLITNGREKTVADETLAEIRDDLKGRKIYVNENVKAEFGDDWNAFRKRAFSLGIQLTNNEKNMGIDSVNAELAELYPGKFDANETDLRSILENMVDTAESGKTSDVPILDAMREVQKQTGEPVREQLQTMLDQFTRQIEIMQDQAAVERKARAGNAAEIAKARKQINEAKEALREVRKQRDAWKRKSEGADARQKRALDAALRGVVQHDAKQIAEAVRQKQALAKKLQDQIDREKKILSGELRAPGLVKLLKAEREKAEARVKKQKEQVFQNYKERKKAGDLRGRIKNLSDEMKRRMTNPTDRAYVPASLYQSMTKLADVLDNVLSPNPGTKAEARYRAMMDAIRGMAREYEDVKNLDPVFASEYEQEISDAIGEIERILERKNASWIDGLTGDTQKGLAELNSNELQQLYDLMRQINYTITNATKVFGNSNYKSIFDAQQAVAEQQNSMKSLNAVSRFERKKRLRLLNSLSVMRATEMMAGWDRSAALYQLMHGIEQGADDAWAWVMDYNKSLQDLKTGKNEKEYRQALTKQLDFGITDRDGLKVTMTKMQALQILMTAEREEHNDKLLHLQAGGAVIRNATDLQNGKGAKARSQTISVTPELIQKISDSLTEWDKSYMKTVRDYFKREGKRTNEILYKLKHKVLKTEEFYVPYTVDRNYLEANLNEQQALNMWVKTPGSTNALKQKAKQPVIIDGMDTVMGQHVKEIGNYIGMAIPIRDFSKVYNGMIPTEGPNPLPVKETIERTFGKAGQHLLTQAVIDVQGGTARQNWESNIAQFLNKLQGAFVKSALLINPSVTIKQAASYIAAESVISHLALERGNHPVWARTDESKSFMPGGLIAQLFARPEGKTAQRIYNEIDQYTSLHYQRRQGMSMAEIAEQANRTGPIKRRINAIGASMEQSKIGHAVRRTGENLNPITWIQRMDVATTAALWVACKEQAKLDKLAVGSEEFWKRTTELYERCIRETQPMYDGLHRTANQKQAGGLMQYLFPFRTVPIQNHGQLAASYEAYKAARESKNEAKIKEAGKFFRKTVWAQTESAFVFSVMTFLAAILKRKTKKYRDEEGEFDAGSFTKGLLTDVGSTLISVLNPMYGSELFNLGSRAVDKFEGNSGYTYDAFSVGVVDMINDLASSGDRLLADAGKIVRGENVNAADFWNHALNLLLKGGKLAGIPADTVKTYFEGTKGNIQDAIEGRIPALNDESWERDAATNARRYLKAYLDNDTKKASAVLAELRSNLSKSGKGEDKINEAIRKAVSAQAIEKVADGTWTEEEAEAYLLSTGAYDDRENPQKDAWNAIRKGVAKATSTDEEFNWKQYDELAEAVANGEDVTDILTEYRNHGYSDDQINGAIKSGIQEALTSGDLDGNEAADALIRYGVTYSKDGKDVSYDEQAAWKKVQEWIDKAEHTDEDGEIEDGYKYSAYADLFDAVDTNKNADGIIQTMVQNGGYDTDSLRGKIKEHLLERFIAGQITETALKNQLSRYCKISKADDANEIVANAKCKRDFGVYPDDLKEAFKDGDLSQNQAEKALQQYKGLSKTDAQNRVRYWGYDGDLSENAWLKWNNELKASGLSVDNWEKVYKVKSSAKGTDANGDGRADSGTVKAEVVSYIDSMNIPKSQKKAIYLAFGWAASTMPSWR